MSDAPPAAEAVTREIASLLDGMEYGSVLRGHIRCRAADAGIVIVFGASDDLIELDGAIFSEADAWGGGSIMVDRDGLVSRDDDDTDEEIAEYVVRSKRAGTITANWDPGDGYSWTYTTSIPHETFEVMEDGEAYCRGIVFRLADAEASS